VLLPTKHLAPAKSLIAVASKVLTVLDYRISPLELWEKYRRSSVPEDRVSFDWFVLALDVLFASGVVRFQDGLVIRTKQ
jgi:hypothetical protein